jgi:hypothetical protein
MVYGALSNFESELGKALNSSLNHSHNPNHLVGHLSRRSSHKGEILLVILLFASVALLAFRALTYLREPCRDFPVWRLTQAPYLNISGRL